MFSMNSRKRRFYIGVALVLGATVISLLSMVLSIAGINIFVAIGLPVSFDFFFVGSIVLEVGLYIAGYAVLNTFNKRFQYAMIMSIIYGVLAIGVPFMQVNGYFDLNVTTILNSLNSLIYLFSCYFCFEGLIDRFYDMGFRRRVKTGNTCMWLFSGFIGVSFICSLATRIPALAENPYTLVALNNIGYGFHIAAFAVFTFYLIVSLIKE